jgi:hypothetical protein
LIASTTLLFVILLASFIAAAVFLGRRLVLAFSMPPRNLFGRAVIVVAMYACHPSWLVLFPSMDALRLLLYLILAVGYGLWSSGRCDASRIATLFSASF